MTRIHKKILLVGNPNSGKSSLFNQLTGSYQKIANYPGVTTERKIGYIRNDHSEYELIDLPGCYSLYPNSIDEKVVISELVLSTCDLIIFTVDASNLSRSLMLYTQIADCKLPILVVVNMIDELEREGLVINFKLLENELGSPVISSNAKKGIGIDSIKNYLFLNQYNLPNYFFGQTDLFARTNETPYIDYREWHTYVFQTAPNAIIENTKRIEIIDRYNKVEKITQLCISKTSQLFKRKELTKQLDQYLMHPVLGYFFIAVILFLVFQLLFTIASYPMDWIDGFFADISDQLSNFTGHKWVDKFTTQAIIPGIAGVIVFIPQIALLFLMNTILEESGYLARMVFLMDRLMRKFGMSGKSILPLLSGNACAIPAIASTRTIPTQKERIITILGIPFMTCSARLPVYTLLITVTIPFGYQGITLLALYFIGICFALLLGFVLNRSIESGEKSFLIMELPPYRFPSFKNIYQNIKNAVIPFVLTAGKYIFTISIILWFLASFQNDHSKISETESIEQSILADIGRFIEPAIRPLGYDWKIGVSLLSSFAAREVFVSTLATLYHFDSESAINQGIILKIKNQVHAETGLSVFTFASGVSLLLFYAFALQCFSTLAAIRRETGSWKYAVYSFFLMFSLAYGSAYIAYQFLHR